MSRRPQRVSISIFPVSLSSEWQALLALSLCLTSESRLRQHPHRPLSLQSLSVVVFFMPFCPRLFTTSPRSQLSTRLVSSRLVSSIISSVSFSLRLSLYWSRALSPLLLSPVSSPYNRLCFALVLKNFLSSFLSPPSILSSHPYSLGVTRCSLCP